MVCLAQNGLPQILNRLPHLARPVQAEDAGGVVVEDGGI